MKNADNIIYTLSLAERFGQRVATRYAPNFYYVIILDKFWQQKLIIMPSLEAVNVSLKSGNESFENNEEKLEFNLNEFWSWSQSDLLNNSLRGVLAEFIIKKALGILSEVKTEWNAYDLELPNGKKIEVKSSAYLQSWEQNKYSEIKFDIAPKRGWNAKTNETLEIPKRYSDYYIFCVLVHKNKSTVNPLELSQWEFYVLETDVLNLRLETQRTINLNSLLSLKPVKCKFEELKTTIN